MDKIRKTSRIIKNIGKVIFWMTAWASVLFGMFILLDIGNLEGVTFTFDSQQIPIAPLDSLSRTTIVLVFWTMVAIFSLGLWHTIKLFQLYEKGKIFFAENINHIKKIGETIIFWAIIKTIAGYILAFVAAYQGLNIEKQISFNLTPLAIGVLLYVISWVMDEGRKLREEHELTI